MGEGFRNGGFRDRKGECKIGMLVMGWEGVKRGLEEEERVKRGWEGWQKRVGGGEKRVGLSEKGVG